MLLRTIVEALGKRQRRRKSRKSSSQGETSKTHNTPPLPLAYALARSWAWPALKFRCETHPQEVSELAVDSRGETILHWTCLGKPPLDTVQAVLTACPDLARMRNHVGHLPLHVAISYRSSVEVIRALLVVFPESAGLPNGVGAYPLHLMCDYGASVEAIQALLETPEGASTITKRLQGRSIVHNSKRTTPLKLLTARMNYPQFRRAILSMQEARRLQQRDIRNNKMVRQQSQEQQTNDSNRQEVAQSAGIGTDTTITSNGSDHERTIASFQTNDYWQKASLLVLVEYAQQPLTPSQGHDDNNPANYIVHACAGIRCLPSFLMEFAILLHMDHLMDRKDGQGRLPLHVAAANHATALCLDDGNHKENQRYMDTSQSTLHAILSACPEAAFVQDSNGDLPLAVALNKMQQHHQNQQSNTSSPSGKGTLSWSSGLQELLVANLQALEALDLSGSLYPYIWAKRMTRVDDLFQSVRQHPNLLQSRITKKAD